MFLFADFKQLTKKLLNSGEAVQQFDNEPQYTHSLLFPVTVAAASCVVASRFDFRSPFALSYAVAQEQS